MLAQIEIMRTGLNGQGVGFDEAKNIYFVEGALPGDTVLVESKSSKRYRDALMIEVVKPSAHRVAPACPHFPECGGCDWLHWEYSSQLRAKEESIAHILSRARLLPEKVFPILESPQKELYRNRIQLRQEGNRVGFQKKGSHEMVAIESCRMAHPSLNREISRLRMESDVATPRRKIELSVTESGDVESFQDSPHGVGGFRQVNSLGNEILKRLVKDRVTESEGKLVLELYCGDGNLTEAYSPTVSQVLGIDVSEAALERARGRKLAGACFIRGQISGAVLQKIPQGFQGRYDTLVLDPPRAGVGRELISFIHPQLESIIYVSCSPLTFSQDVKALSTQGFAFRSLQPLDMFPHTKHVELVAAFSR